MLRGEGVGGSRQRLRQMLHELRTPVNAIQGFAEIIQQQLFGPTPHDYRALAATIAGDAARMLAGFEELERFARLDSGEMVLAEGVSDLGACIAATLARLASHMESRGGGFAIEGDAHRKRAAMMVAIAPDDSEILCWRLLASLAASAGPGEALKIELGRIDTAVAAIPPFCESSTDQCCVFLPPRMSRADTSKGPSAIGPQKLTVSAIGSASLLSSIITALSRTAAVAPPNGPAILA